MNAKNRLRPLKWHNLFINIPEGDKVSMLTHVYPHKSLIMKNPGVHRQS